MTRLAKHNELIQLETGVWVKADTRDRSFIDYSDGSSTEELVYAKVEAAEDRSVFSEALDQNWAEWALEYHLGSKRSNIYRGLNLNGVNTVLEVGCGCGAITRFLGEQGFAVDSIEGTMRRAEIARLRTQDLDNVQIISSNYHDLALGESSYDLIVFTGVLEYSGAYAPEGVLPEAQLAATLKHAKGALSQSGQILIAIENRTGYKYLAGASEDHLNVPNIGLLGYKSSSEIDITRGIRTWSKSEWSEMLSNNGFAAYEFCYPFPDYKIPSAILSDHFLETVSYPEQVLGSIRSRDYFTMWAPKIQESLFWKTAAQTKSIDQFANSFLIVVGDDEAAIERTIDFDFVRFASESRHLGYRMQVSKQQSENVIRRWPLLKNAKTTGQTVSHKQIEKEAFIDGQILEQVWQDALSVTTSDEEIALHIKTYSAWLDELVKEGADQYVDALPRNIIIDDVGAWHLIDQEWRAKESLSKALILTRALYYFAVSAWQLIPDIEFTISGRPSELQSDESDLSIVESIDDFVRWGLKIAGIEYDLIRGRFIDFEFGLQKQVTRAGFSRSIEQMLDTQLHQGRLESALSEMPPFIDVRVFWTRVDGVWHMDHSVSKVIEFEQGYSVEVILPQMLKTHRFLRIDPVVDLLHVVQGGIKLKHLKLIEANSSGDETVVYAVSSTKALFESAKLKGVGAINDNAMLFVTDDVQIVLDLHAVPWSEESSTIKLEFGIQTLNQVDFVLARKLLREELLRAVPRARFRQKMLDRQQQRIAEASQTLKNLELKIAQHQELLPKERSPIRRLLNKIKR